MKKLLSVFLLGICLSLPVFAQETAQLVVPDTILIKNINGEPFNRGRAFPGGKLTTSETITIPAGTLRLEMDYMHRKTGEYYVRGIVVTYTFEAGNTYAIVGEAKWIEASVALKNQGLRLYILEAFDNDDFEHFFPAPARTNPVDAAFSPDNSLVAYCAGRDIYIYNLRDGSLAQTLTGHRGNVYAIRFNAAGDKLISVSDDKTVRSWNLDGSGSFTTLITGVDKASNIAWNNDASLMAAASFSVKIFNTETGQLITDFRGHGRNAFLRSRLSFNNDGSRIMSIINPVGRGGATAIIWDPLTGTEISRKQFGSYTTISGITWLPDGNRFYLAQEEDFPLVLYDVNFHEQNTIQMPLENPVWNTKLGGYFNMPSLSLRPNSRQLIVLSIGSTVSSNTTINVINTENGILMNSFASQSDESSPRRVIFNRNGSQAAFVSPDGIRVLMLD